MPDSHEGKVVRTTDGFAVNAHNTQAEGEEKKSENLITQSQGVSIHCKHMLSIQLSFSLTHTLQTYSRMSCHETGTSHNATK